MNSLLRITTYLFHPLWMPFAGTLLYFLITPRFFPFEVIKSKLLAIAIMTLFIPVVFHFLLRTLGWNTSHVLKDVRERKWPLVFYIFLIWIILKFVLNTSDYPELYFYFTGILFSSMIGLLLVLLNYKVSLHMMGLGGLTMFLVFLSVYFNLNLVYTISFFVAIGGLTATSRLHLKAHDYSELIFGYLLGVLPQATVFYIWGL